MTLLTTNLSPAAEAVLADMPGAVDALEIGPWLSLEKLQAARARWPRMPFHFHGGNLVKQVGFPGVIQRAQAYVQQSASPWGSFHLIIWPYWMVWLMYRYHIPLPSPNPPRQTQRFIRQVRQLQQALPVPLTLENIEFVPSQRFIANIQPGLIRHVLEETGCDLLLDLGHARVAAAKLGIAAEDYLLQLPLERTAQIHVSGPRIKNGRLFDAHETLQEEDYALLSFVLQRTQPRAVTLEFIREQNALLDQLLRLRQMLNR